VRGLSFKCAPTFFQLSTLIERHVRQLGIPKVMADIFGIKNNGEVTVTKVWASPISLAPHLIPTRSTNALVAQIMWNSFFRTSI
jgi:hypothetical protein